MEPLAFKDFSGILLHPEEGFLLLFAQVLKDLYEHSLEPYLTPACKALTSTSFQKLDTLV